MSEKREIAVSARDVEVSFLVQQQGLNSIKQYLFSLGRKKMFERKHILKGVSVDVYKGECFGLLGKNGSGKSTFLRTLAGIIPTEKGTIEVKGRIAPLLTLGAGLELEMNGIENIRLCCTLMGLRQKEISGLMESIIDFSELGKDIEMQTKRYSTGMMARLSFSMVVATNPDILVVDEALSVGDKGFQNKCMAKIKEMRQGGTTIIYVSHNDQEIARLCDRVAWMKDGRIEMVGEVKAVSEMYLKHFQ